jgi:hypothetical protein
MRRPGDRLRALATRVCSARAMERVLDPAITDLRWEHQDALRQQRQWRARWIRTTGSLMVLYLIATHVRGPLTTLAPRNDGPSMVRVLAGSATVVAVMSAVLIAIVMSNTPFPLVQRGWLVLYLLPSTLPLTVPWGFAVAATCSSTGASWRTAPRLLVGAVMLSLLTFVTIGWITPVANQAYRVTAAGQQVRLGFNELTLPETRRRLAAERERLSRPFGFGSNAVLPTLELRAAEYSYQARVAAALAPLVLGLFACGINNLRRIVRVAAMMAVLGLYFSWYGALRSPVQTFATLSPAVVAWLPNITLLGVAALSSAIAANTKRGGAPA